MRVGWAKLAPLWALALALACCQHTGQAQGDALKSSYKQHPSLSPARGHGGDPLRGVTLLSPLRPLPVVQALNPAHNGQVCSTWGDFHYKTFDGRVFRFPGLCNYVFSAHCGAAYEDFNVQLRRGPLSNTSALQVTMKLDGLVVQLAKSSVLLELDGKYANKTCGLCGDFNGSPASSEFVVHNVKLTPLEFGNLQKMDGPTEQCQDPVPEPQKNCSNSHGICDEILRSRLFSGCAALVDVGSYVEACRQDVCRCAHAHLPTCLCHTLAEYSRQCAHAGGQPQDWRGPDLCPRTCPLNMQHQECGSPCVDTCSNPQRSQTCEDHCVAGCFCPKGLVHDDIGQTGCVPVSQCACLYNGTAYAPGANYSTDCTTTCSGGRWGCREVPCPGTCSVLGGSHFSTFDERQYTVHGDCSYVLTKPCDSGAFTVLAELRRCGLTDSETCLKSVTLSLGGGQTVVVMKASGEVFVNQIYTQLPVSAANVTLFRPSTFFIIAQTTLGLQLDVQLVPTMQVFVRLAPELRGLTCGLCGNFNSIQADDFRTISGVVEGTAAAFFNTFKTQAACPNVKNIFEDPCSLSVENEKYAQYWCSQLTNSNGPFSQCHATVNPAAYYSNCMFDTCNCEKSEDCMCAALSSYVRACAARGVLLSGWRDGLCTKPTTTCPKSMSYHYHISTCQPTCRSLSQEDVTCQVSFVPVDGCACPEGTFLDDMGKCVAAASCPCYHRGSLVPNGESVHDNGAVCTCTTGSLTCIGGPAPTPVCEAPMVYFDCRNATAGATGAGCQKSCHTLDMACYSPQCVPGCVCPDGLVADGDGGCVAVEDCPCVHNEATYRRGETIRVGCNTCTCESRKWQCTDEPCLATCSVYGDGHYLTFDGQRYSFSGDCEYTLVQDHCSGNSSAQGTFRVVTENVPCGTTGTTCSKAIKLFLGHYELKLSDGKVEVVQKEAGQEMPFSIRQVGVYLVVETDVGLVLLWDRRTSIFLRLDPEFKGRVCGLCGNFDDNAINDFTTRSQSVVGDALEFGNSWKFSPSCPDALVPKDPCTANPYRKSWAQKQCSIINSKTFAACHAHVEPTKYYEACVSDACACDAGGDCECLCTAVAAYAQACHDVGVCVSWRTPDVCPLFCDYYNAEGQCTWHYQPCGAPCMRTCQNPSGQCLNGLRGLEGCYPQCSADTPIFDEDKMQCVATCPTPPPPPPICRVHGKSYRLGAAVPSDQNCHSCVCTERGTHCVHDPQACVCTYGGSRFHPGDVIYHTADGTGGCITARCGAEGTIERKTYACSPTTPGPTTTFSFSTAPPAPAPVPALSPSLPTAVSSRQTVGTGPSPTQSTARTEPPSTASSSREMPGTTSVRTSSGCEDQCLWSPWLDVSRPGLGLDSGDFETLENLRAHGFRVCPAPRAVQCRAEGAPEERPLAPGQRVDCSPTVGLSCRNRDQASGLCHNYQVRILCCSPAPCSSSGSPEPTLSTASSTARPGTTASPAASTSATVSTASAPVPAPGTSTPALSTPTPAPGTPTPAPDTPTPAPRTPTPAPRTPTPAQTTLPTTSIMHVSTTSARPSMSTMGTEATAHTHSLTSPGGPCRRELCEWTQWMDGSYPKPDRNSGDFDTFENLRSQGFQFCERPQQVDCRAQFFPNTPLAELGQDVTCSLEQGLICLNKNQLPPICYNYEIRVKCCRTVDQCATSMRAPTGAGPRNTSPQTPATGWTASRHSPADSSAPVPRTRNSTGRTQTRTAPVTTNCQPQCNWTKWFNVDSPVPGPHGGDVETYSRILRAGEQICSRPEEITRLQCRAESYPEASLESLGQVVLCDPDVGLLCRNQDQLGTQRKCLDYSVRVLCCRQPEGCGVTPTVPHTISTASAWSPPPSQSAPSSPWTSGSLSVSTPKCFCNVHNHLYAAGSTVYLQRDLEGHCYHATCSQDCLVIRGVDQDCPSTPQPPTPSLSPSPSSPSPPPTSPSGSSPAHWCHNVIPPRKKGETWAMANCSQATCEEDHSVSLSPRTCPEIEAPACANGYPALKVDDEDGCCQHYQCQCVCSGWGDPHYITFDGTYYTFLDNCTYVLLQQIVPVFGHLRVLVDNYFCDPKDQVSCPQSIIVEYHQDRVVLTRRPVGGVMTNQILFNDEVVSPGFQRNGIAVSRVGIKMYVTIHEIGVQVMFSGLIFSVEVPFHTFANNTEGQCGTCSNNQRDECRLPRGAVASSCSQMAGHWKVHIPGQPSCSGPPPPPSSVVPTPPPAWCPPSPLCQLILGDVFQPCHATVPPQPFLEGCAFDHCYSTDMQVQCSSLELYASLCASFGVCIDWRSHTNGSCQFSCPADKVYQPCGPSRVRYCYGNDSASIWYRTGPTVALPEAGPFTEGCFCPDTMTLFSNEVPVCVSSECPVCLGPRGEPVEPGRTVSADCQECTCDPATLALSCRRTPCALPPVCRAPGFVPVPAAPEAGQCCQEFTCACNSSYCPEPLDCPEGSIRVVTYEEGACCPSQNCSECLQPFCNVNGTLYKPGAIIHSSLCETCRCEAPSNSPVDTLVVNCETQHCDTHCPLGFEYQAHSGQCCGLCVQKYCVVVNSSSDDAHLVRVSGHRHGAGSRSRGEPLTRGPASFQAGETWTEPGNGCVTHRCERRGDRLEVVTKVACSANCSQDQDGQENHACPQINNGSSCTVHHRDETVEQDGCRGSVRASYCQGHCGESMSKYSLEANTVEHRCQCCQELRTSPSNATLRCPDGSSRVFSYTQVDECSCLQQQCQGPGGTSR
ncbi:PREDICTED: mucin-5AC [Dipodomys ordii]|uniref:Mucin-2 n=1 Tax=Dipodomys ordii TaxID=10020 RepID=A0A1S3GJ39_DIPOR|nr:PREDICTED: mucin-5AC [Dipodomys ordii]